MLSLIAEVKLAGSLYKNVASVKIVTSTDEFMDTATLILPQAARGKFKKGDEVSIRLGYDRYDFNPEFYGVVTDVSQQPPYEIHCADLFYELRQKNLQRAYFKKTISYIIDDVLRGTGITALYGVRAKTQTLAKFITSGVGSKGPYNLTIRAIIQKLANDHGYFAYFSEKKLRFLHRSEAVLPWEKYPLYEEGVNIIQNNLLYGQPDTIKQIKVVSEHRVGSFVYALYPESGKVKNPTGEVRSYYVDGLGDGMACYGRAKELYDQLTASGFYGELRTIGHPYVRAGQFCGIKLKSIAQPTVQAIRKTEVTFDRGGFRRLIIPMTTPQDVVDKNQLLRKVAAVNYLSTAGSR